MPRRIRAPIPPTFEPLEPRALFALISWDGGGNGTTWEDPLNWSTNALPAAADDVTIDLPANPSISLSSGARSVRSLILAESLTITGGSLAVTTTAAVAAGGALTVNGGSLLGGSWDSTAGALLAGTSTASTLSAVTLNGDLTLPGGANLRISSGITLGPQGRIRLTGALSNNLGFAGNQTLASGVISLENTSGLGFVGCIGTGTLTIGPAASIVGGRAVLGQNVFSAGNSGLINQGTITSNVAGTSISVNTSGTAALSSAGTIQAQAGATLAMLAGTWTSTGTLRADSGATLTLSGAWTSTGPLTCDNATLNLGGTFARSSLATLSRFGGQVNIVGTLNLAGEVLALDASTGSFTLNAGTISNGTIALTQGGSLLFTASNLSTLSAVTVSGDLVLTAGQSLRITSGLTFSANSSLRLSGDGATLGFVGTQTLTGGEIVVENPTGAATLGLVGPGALTFSPTTRIRGGRGSIGPAVFGGLAGTLANQGTIAADTPGTTLTISPGGSFTNSGTIRGATGSTLAVAASGAFNNTGTVEAAGGTVTISGSVVNYASQTLTGGTWRVLDASTLTFGPGPITGNSATIHLAGAAVFDALSGLATNQGSLTIADGHDFSFVPASGTFTNALAGRLTKSGSGSATIPASIRVDNVGTIAVAGSGRLTIAGLITQLTGASLIAGTWRAQDDGTLILPAIVNTNAASLYLGGNGSIPATSTLGSNTGTLTLADGHAFSFVPGGGVFLNGPNATFVKAGTGATTIPAGLVFNNSGRVRVSGGTLDIDATIPQLSGGSLTAGAWQVDDGTLDLPSSITSSAASITLAGPLAAFPAVHGLRTNSGTLTLRAGGRLTLFSLANSGTLALEPGGLLSLAGAFDHSGTLTATGGSLVALGGGTWSGAAALSGASALTLGGDFALTAAAAISGPAGSLWLASGAISSLAAITGSLTIRVSGATAAISGTLAATITLIVSSGEARFTGAAALASVQLLGGMLSGPADLTIATSFLWSGGVLGGAGRLFLLGTSTTTINGAAIKTLSRTLESSGTVNWTAGSIATDGGSFLNRQNATVNVSSPLGIWSAAGAGGLFTNAGTLNKTTTGSTTLSIPLNNTGLVRLQAGILYLSGGGAHSGDFTLSAGKIYLGGVHGATVGADFAGAGTLVIDGSLTSAGAFAHTGRTIITGQAVLSGAVNAGPLSLHGGSLTLGSNATLASVHNAGSLFLGNKTLTVSGAYTQTAAGALDLRIDGLLPAEYGRIAAAGAVSLAGSVHVSWGAPFYPRDGEGFNLVAGSTRSGTFTTTLVDSLGPNRAFVFSYTGTAARLIVRARIYEER